MRRVDRNHPDFEELFDLAERIAQAKNPQRWFDGQKAIDDGTTSNLEYKADQILLEGEMQDRLEGGVIRDFVEGKLRIR